MKYEVTIKTLVYGIEEKMQFICNTIESVYKVIEDNFSEGDEVIIKTLV